MLTGFTSVGKRESEVDSAREHMRDYHHRPRNIFKGKE